MLQRASAAVQCGDSDAGLLARLRGVVEAARKAQDLECEHFASDGVPRPADGKCECCRTLDRYIREIKERAELCAI